VGKLLVYVCLWVGVLCCYIGGFMGCVGVYCECVLVCVVWGGVIGCVFLLFVWCILCCVLYGWVCDGG
jgi:hypothetical protein